MNDPLAPSSSSAPRQALERSSSNATSQGEAKAVETAPGGRERAAAPSVEAREQAQQQTVEQAQIKELARIDREVRAHEAAHAAAGGAIAGSPSYQFTRGPDGRLYATGGEVGIDTGAVRGDPEATIEKARTIIQAALAPANPSPQDLRVAAQAQALLVEAQAELSRLDAEAETQSQSQTQRGESSEAAEGTGDDPSRDDEAAARRRDAAEERQARLREQQAEFAEQFREMNERLNEVSKRLIDAGVIEILEPEGVFLDLLA